MTATTSTGNTKRALPLAELAPLPPKKAKTEIPNDVAKFLSKEMKGTIKTLKRLAMNDADDPQEVLTQVRSSLSELIAAISECTNETFKRQHMSASQSIESIQALATTIKGPIEFLQLVVNEDWEQVFQRVDFRPRRLRTPSPPTSLGTRGDLDLKVAERAWNQPFVGDHHKLLIQYINDLNHDHASKKKNDMFQTFFSIIQSSGCGKSRVVDEAAKVIFTIPFNLRSSKDTTGFPLRDEAAADFFEVQQPWLNDEVKTRYLLFLHEVFEQVAIRLEAMEPAASRQELANAWHRHFFSADVRTTLYKCASDAATKRFLELVPKSQTPALLDPLGIEADQTQMKDTMTAVKATQALVVASALAAAKSLVNLILKKSNYIASEQKQAPDVALLLSFDEAHGLHDVRTTHMKIPTGTKSYVAEERTGYYALCSALDEFKKLDIFSIFMSTASSLTKFAPVKTLLPASARSTDAEWDLRPPYTELPFDIHTEKEPLFQEGQYSLQDVCRPEFMVRFGRPLWKSSYTDAHQIIEFAKFKLLGVKPKSENTDLVTVSDGFLAAISTRLLLDFEPRREEAREKENALVRNHMRIAFSIPKHRYYMRTGTPSEPIAAEAAAHIMYDGQLPDVGMINGRFQVLKKLQKSLIDGLLDKGEMGELVARLLLIFAHDSAVHASLANLKGPDPYLTEGSIGVVPSAQNSTTATSSEPESSANAPSPEKPWGIGFYSRPVKVTEFIKALFQPQFAELVLNATPRNVVNGLPFREAFKDAYIHFTHFGRTEAPEVLTDEAALAALCRAMGWVFYRTQEGVDIGIPMYLYGITSKLTVKGMTMLFLQIKNKFRAQRVQIDVSKKPFSFFTSNEADARPYIVIVMNLGVEYNILKDQTQQKGKGYGYDFNKSPSKVQPATSKQRGSSRRPATAIHPCYHINVDGCSPTVYRVIDESHRAIYASLLSARNMLHEHPRLQTPYINAVFQMKPFWNVGSAWFSWIRYLNQQPLAEMDLEPRVTVDTATNDEDTDDENLVDAPAGPGDVFMEEANRQTIGAAI